MTLVSEIITDAYRLGNLVPIGTVPNAAQQTEGLRYLNRIVLSAIGNEAGDPLQAFPVGRRNIERPSGWPWYDGVPDNDWFVPKNIRVMLNLNGSVNLYLHPSPDDGSRFAAIDVSNNLSTFPVTVLGNGRLIEGATSIVLNTNGEDKEWFYRADLGEWQLCSPLAITDDFPFPSDFDDFFIISLAMRLNPSYSQEMDPQTQFVFKRSGNQLKARYNQTIPMASEPGLYRLPRTSQDRWAWNNEYYFYNPNAMFDRGWPGFY